MQKAFSGGVVLVNARMAHHHPMLGIFNITIEGVDGGAGGRVPRSTSVCSSIFFINLTKT